MERITQIPNPITFDIDLSSPEKHVELLQQCDQQIFEGYQTYLPLKSDQLFASLEKIINRLRQKTVSENTSAVPNISILLSGAGTSGRIAYFCSRAMNSVLKKYYPSMTVDYLISGGDAALIVGIEGAEDDVNLAIQDLEKKLAERKIDYLIYIGITCGLSAPYVASQLDWIMDKIESGSNYVAVLMGFNPVELSRNSPIENWNKTFYQVASRLKHKLGDDKHFLLTPVVGPEGITGSTRMKSGTTTIILLWVFFAKLFQDLFGATLFPELNNAFIFSSSIAGASLNHDRSVYYIGEDNLGILGLIDASECRPTYGSKLSDIRGFVIGGWNTIRNYSGDISYLGEFYNISELVFIDKIVPKISERDTVIILHSDQQPTSTLERVIEAVNSTNKSINWGYICWSRKGTFDSNILAKLPNDPTVVLVTLPCYYLMDNLPAFLDISTKWVLNTISTGAHILKGKVYQNRMIDVGITNNKLYHRAKDLLQVLTGVSSEVANSSILKAIYECDEVNEDLKSLPISKHIEKASTRKKVVPLAMLLATGKYGTVAEASLVLKKEPIIRNLIQNILCQQK